MTRGSLRASPEGIKKAKRALSHNGLTQKALAEDLLMSRSTVSKFFNGHPVDRTIFEEISKKLGLDWKEIFARPASEPESEGSLESVVSSMLKKIESQQGKETPDLQKINAITAIKQLLEHLDSTSLPGYLNEITKDVAQDKINRLHAHFALADYLESSEVRQSLARTSAAITMKHEVFEKVWKSSTKREQAKEKLSNLLYTCLGWLLDSIKEFHNLEISDKFRKGLRSWHPDILKYAFETLKNKAMSCTGSKELASEVNTYLNLLIERIYSV